jgi:NAD(P)-dependent dehydrogenase (short-subunit alcohol dehydrogenase family)
MDSDRLRALYDLTGRVAIVTGGTRGIGRSIAEGLVAAGASVVVASRKPAACAETAEHLREQGGKAIGVPTHMADLDSIAALVDRTIAEFGRLDIVVNNAANALAQPLGQLTPDAWQKSLDTNLRGPVFLVERALPHLEASGNAAVLNVISAGAFLFSAHTDMVLNNTPEAVESMSRAAFMRRGAHPDEMVGPALLLCSDAGSFITGQVILADGGLTPH